MRMYMDIRSVVLLTLLLCRLPSTASLMVVVIYRSPSPGCCRCSGYRSLVISAARHVLMLRYVLLAPSPSPYRPPVSPGLLAVVDRHSRLFPPPQRVPAPANARFGRPFDLRPSKCPHSASARPDQCPLQCVPTSTPAEARLDQSPPPPQQSQALRLGKCLPPASTRPSSQQRLPQRASGPLPCECPPSLAAGARIGLIPRPWSISPDGPASPATAHLVLLPLPLPVCRSDTLPQRPPFPATVRLVLFPNSAATFPRDSPSGSVPPLHEPGPSDRLL